MAGILGLGSVILLRKFARWAIFSQLYFSLSKNIWYFKFFILRLHFEQVAKTMLKENNQYLQDHKTLTQIMRKSSHKGQKLMVIHNFPFLTMA